MKASEAAQKGALYFGDMRAFLPPVYDLNTIRQQQQQQQLEYQQQLRREQQQQEEEEEPQNGDARDVEVQEEEGPSRDHW